MVESDHDELFGRLLSEYIDLSESEALDPDLIRDEHPQHAEELIEVLTEIGLIATELIDSIPSIPGYGKLEALGRGAMGQVFVATQERTGRKVALKFLAPELARSGQARRRFLREGETAARIRHAHVVTVHDAAMVERQPYLVMEYVEGSSLATVIREGEKPTDSESLRLVVERIESIARALAAVHDAGLLHRDVKPENIVVEGEGRAVLVDFGLARDFDTHGLTRTGHILGTPRYIAPEQFRGGRIDQRADVYSLGATLYECLTQKPPFETEVLAQLLRDIETLQPIPAREQNSAVSKDLSHVVGRAIEKDPDHRYLNAGAFADDLHRFLEGEPVRARKSSASRRIRSWSRRNPAVATSLFGGISLLVLGISSLGFLLWRNAVEEHNRVRAEIERAIRLSGIPEATNPTPETLRTLLEGSVSDWEDIQVDATHGIAAVYEASFAFEQAALVLDTLPDRASPSRWQKLRERVFRRVGRAGRNATQPVTTALEALKSRRAWKIPAADYLRVCALQLDEDPAFELLVACDNRLYSIEPAGTETTQLVCAEERVRCFFRMIPESDGQVCWLLGLRPFEGMDRISFWRWESGKLRFVHEIAEGHRIAAIMNSAVAVSLPLRDSTEAVPGILVGADNTMRRLVFYYERGGVLRREVLLDVGSDVDSFEVLHNEERDHPRILVSCGRWDAYRAILLTYEEGIGYVSADVLSTGIGMLCRSLGPSRALLGIGQRVTDPSQFSTRNPRAIEPGYYILDFAATPKLTALDRYAYGEVDVRLQADAFGTVANCEAWATSASRSGWPEEFDIRLFLFRNGVYLGATVLPTQRDVQDMLFADVDGDEIDELVVLGEELVIYGR